MIRLAGLLALFCAIPALARPLHPRFEPDDLELEAPGTIEIDLQLGAIRGQKEWRGVVPDLELDVGILPNLELDLGWTYAFSVPKFVSTPDNLWLSTKIGLWSVHDELHQNLWAIGLQTGPHFPVAPGATSVGWESLLMIGRMRPSAQLVVNLGGVVDPQAGRAQLGLEAGCQLDLPLDERQVFNLSLALATVYFLSHDAAQLTATATIEWNPSPATTIGLSALVGFTPGSDRFGVLVGFSQKVRRTR